jgi:hypothetical protein
MGRSSLTGLAAIAAVLALAGPAHARGGAYVFEGGSPAARAQVRAALQASTFDWGLVRGVVTIEIGRCGCAGSVPGRIVLDEDQLTSSPFGPRYSWGIVQHEYAHQIDFHQLDPGERAALRRQLGGRDWCYEQPGLGHDDHACERFATTVAWAFWRSPQNVQRPAWAGRKPTATDFRRLVNRLAESRGGRRAPEGRDARLADAS